MKHLFFLLALLPLAGHAQSLLRPPAWQVKADWTNDSAYVTSSGNDVQEILDNLDLVTTNLYLRTTYPNLDTDSTDDVTNVVEGAAVVGGSVTETNGTVTIGFPDLTGYVTNVVKGSATAGGAVTVTGGTATIQFPTTNSTAAAVATGVPELVIRRRAVGGTSSGLEPNNDAINTAHILVTWTASEDQAGDSFTHPDFSGAFDYTTGKFTPPADGVFLIQASAAIDNNLGTAHNGAIDLKVSTGTGLVALSEYGFSSADDNTDERGIQINVTRPVTTAAPVGFYIHGNSSSQPISLNYFAFSIYRLGD